MTSAWNTVKDTYVKNVTVKMLKENMGYFLYNLGVRGFSNSDSKWRRLKEKIGGFDHIKIRNLYIARNPINKAKRQITNWGKFFYSYYRQKIVKK